MSIVKFAEGKENVDLIRAKSSNIMLRASVRVEVDVQHKLKPAFFVTDKKIEGDEKNRLFSPINKLTSSSFHKCTKPAEDGETKRTTTKCYVVKKKMRKNVVKEKGRSSSVPNYKDEG